MAEVFQRMSAGGQDESGEGGQGGQEDFRKNPGEVGRRRPGEVGRRPGRRPGGGQEEAGEASREDSREEPKEDSREEPGDCQSVVNSSKSEGGWQFSATAPGPLRNRSGRMGGKLGLLLRSEDLGGGPSILRNPGYPIAHNTPGDPSYLGVGGLNALHLKPLLLFHSTVLLFRI